MNILQGTSARKIAATVAGTLLLATGAATASASTPVGSGAGAAAAATPAAAFDLPAVPGSLTGSGATFPQAFYGEAIAELEGLNGDLTIEYSGGGSGTGQTDLQGKLKDFAGTDDPVKEEDLELFTGGDFLYVPTVVAPITLSFNVEGVDHLNLTPATVAGIFQLTITNWNDEAIAADNPDVELPDLPIVVVRRADGSGTTANFTKFLDNSVGEGGDGTWTLGAGKELEWPDGTQAGDGSSGVAQLISDTAGAIGYLDLSDAVESGFTTAAVQNSNGEFVDPTLEATTIAASGAEVGEDGTYFAGWSDAPGAYPIAAQTWIIVYATQPDAEKVAALQYFLTYLVSAEGQALAEELSYAPLPDSIRQIATDNIAAITTG